MIKKTPTLTLMKAPKAEKPIKLMRKMKKWLNTRSKKIRSAFRLVQSSDLFPAERRKPRWRQLKEITKAPQTR